MINIVRYQMSSCKMRSSPAISISFLGWWYAMSVPYFALSLLLVMVVVFIQCSINISLLLACCWFCSCSSLWRIWNINVWNILEMVAILQSQTNLWTSGAQMRQPHISLQLKKHVRVIWHFFTSNNKMICVWWALHGGWMYGCNWACAKIVFKFHLTRIGVLLAAKDIIDDFDNL